jgi:hypothetical protein
MPAVKTCVAWMMLCACAATAAAGTNDPVSPRLAAMLARGTWVRVRMHEAAVRERPGRDVDPVVPLPVPVGESHSRFVNPPEVFLPPPRRLAPPVTRSGEGAPADDTPGGLGWLADAVFRQQAREEAVARARQSELLRRRKLWVDWRERRERRLEESFSPRFRREEEASREGRGDGGPGVP